MKQKHLIILGMATLLFASCGPHRYSCGGKRRCVTSVEQQEKQQPLNKQETPKRNA